MACTALSYSNSLMPCVGGVYSVELLNVKPYLHVHLYISFYNRFFRYVCIHTQYTYFKVYINII